MDRDYLILLIVIISGFLLNIFVNYSTGLSIFPIFEPDFCGDSYSPLFCKNLFGFIQLAGIVVILFFVVGKKFRERIRG